MMNDKTKVVVIQYDESGLKIEPEFQISDATNAVANKPIEAWFLPSNDGYGWKGLLTEIRKDYMDPNAAWYFIFRGSEEHKEEFFYQLKKYSVSQGIRLSDRFPNKEFIAKWMEEGKRAEEKMPDEALKRYLIAADEANDPEAQYRAALIYKRVWQGISEIRTMSFEEAYEKMLAYFEKSAKQDYFHAQTELVSLFYAGQMCDEKGALWLTKVAERNDIEAQYYLGCCYVSGRGVKTDNKQAAYWYEMAANRDHIGAQFELGECYYREKNYSQAVAWYEKAAERGYVKAQYKLGWCYEHGVGRARNFSLAIDCYDPAANQGHAGAQYRLGLLYDKNGTYEALEKAYYWFGEASKQGHVKAKYCLGSCYENGKGISKNQDLALALYEESAKLGCSDAQYRLGEIKEKTEPTIAVDWYRMAAAQNDKKAQYRLGFCYEKGLGVEQDFSMAVELYEKSAKQGYEKAQYHLGLCYENGIGAEQCLSEAFRCYKDAEERGHIEATYRLGFFYENGYSIEQCLREAFRCYEKVCKKHTEAQYRLGLCYEYGRGTEINLEEASRCYEAAAERNHIEATYRLGLSYETDQNRLKALDCYKQAADKNHADAQYRWGLLYEQLMEKSKVTGKIVMDYYRKSAGQGNVLAQYKLGQIYSADSKRKDAWEWYDKAASQGHVEAMYQAAKLCKYGLKKQDQEAYAFARYQFAAEQGHIPSQHELAECYRYGRGTDKDFSMAICVYEKILEKQPEEASVYYEIAECYLEMFAFREEYSPTVEVDEHIESQGDSIREKRRVIRAINEYINNPIVIGIALNSKMSVEDILDWKVDILEAVECYKKAEELGSKDSAKRLKSFENESRKTKKQ